MHPLQTEGGHGWREPDLVAAVQLSHGPPRGPCGAVGIELALRPPLAPLLQQQVHQPSSRILTALLIRQLVEVVPGGERGRAR